MRAAGRGCRARGDRSNRSDASIKSDRNLQRTSMRGVEPAPAIVTSGKDARTAPLASGGSPPLASQLHQPNVTPIRPQVEPLTVDPACAYPAPARITQITSAEKTVRWRGEHRRHQDREKPNGFKHRAKLPGGVRIPTPKPRHSEALTFPRSPLSTSDIQP